MLHKIFLSLVCLFLVSSEVLANDEVSNDKYFSQSDLCESEIQKAEKVNNIPRRLLAAIATVESGRSVRVSNNNKKTEKAPWPWTICAYGKGHFFSTKSAAIAAVKKLFARGVRNIDVGCMQVNLLHHSKAFKNLEEAFTPKYNVAYAAKYFMQLRNMTNSWTHAVGYYHSRTAKHYKRYCVTVFNEWKKARNRAVNMSLKVQLASADVKSKISFLPSYYSLIDSNLSEKLHKLGRQTLLRRAPKFFSR